MQAELQAQHKTYAEQRPELKALVGDFIGSVLLEKPDDVLAFAVQHFRKLRGAKGDLPRPLLLVGPTGSGRKTLLKMLSDEFENIFEQAAADYGGLDASSQSKRADFIKESVNSHGDDRVLLSRVSTALAKQLKKSDVSGQIVPRFVFVHSPLSGLENRIRESLGRDGDDEEDDTIVKGLVQQATADIEYGTEEGNFHLSVANGDNIYDCYEKIKEFVISAYAEEIKKSSKK